MQSKGATSVLIVGAGPVGLALACDLGHRGVDCVLVERRDGAVRVPKMSVVSARNMEFCRRWNIAEAARDAVWPKTHPLDIIYMESLRGPEFGRIKLPSYAARGQLPFTPEGNIHCPQIYFDPILLGKVRTLPSVKLRYRTSLEAFSQDEDDVDVRLVDVASGRVETLRARYLVGCDGPSGLVREALNIPLTGIGVVSNSINIFFRSPQLAKLHDKGWGRMYRVIDAQGCWGELIPIDGISSWRLTVFHDPDGEVEAGDYLRKAVGGDFAFEIVSVDSWERRDYVAERYGEGRVFIAGDAAHQSSPTGGLGMATGIEDVVNLGWKLEAMLAGWGGQNLLPSYGMERKPQATRIVQLSTRAYREIMRIPGTDGQADARDADSPSGPLKGWNLGRFTIAEHVKLQYCYEASTICVADGTPPSTDLEPLTFMPSTRPGARAPHAWLPDGTSTIDLFGNGYVLLRFGADAPDAAPLVKAAAAQRLPLRVVEIGDPAIAALYERKLVLVRPDGHVSWRGDVAPADPEATVSLVRGGSLD